MRKWLIGCSVVVVFLGALLVAVGIVATSWFKSRFPDAHRLESLRAELRQSYGDDESFVPPHDGSLPADRLAVFAALRDSLAVYRTAHAGALRFVSDARSWQSSRRPIVEKIGDKIGLMEGGLTMVGGLLEYFGHQWGLMRDLEMGPGEYAFYRALTSFAWLQWDPTAVPEDVEKLRSMEMREEVEAGVPAAARLFRRQLENARRALEAEPERTPAAEALLQALASEPASTPSKQDFPLAGRLPSGWADALAPYRERLQAVLPHGAGEIALEMLQPSTEKRGVQFRVGERRHPRPSERP